MSEETRELFNHWLLTGTSRPGNWNNGEDFSYFWFAFNVVMADISGQRGDRRMLNWIKNNDNLLRDAFEARLAHEPFIERLMQLQRMCPVADARDLSEVTILNIRDMGEVIEVIYKIRCNFMHGNKPSNGRNDPLFEVSAHILKYWLEVVYISPNSQPEG